MHGEPVQAVGLDDAGPGVVLGPHPRQVEVGRRQRQPEHVDAQVHPAFGGNILKRDGQRRLSRAGSAVEDDEVAPRAALAVTAIAARDYRSWWGIEVMFMCLLVELGMRVGAARAPGRRGPRRLVRPPDRSRRTSQNPQQLRS